MSEKKSPTALSDNAGMMREAMRNLYLAGELDFSGYRDGRPAFTASDRRHRFMVMLRRRLRFTVCKALGLPTIDDCTEDDSAADSINLEFVLLLRNDKVVMAVKRKTRASTEAPAGEAAPIQIILFHSERPTEHRLEAILFVLPVDQSRVNWAEFTPMSIEIDQIVQACRNAIWWQDWKAEFEKTIASDATLTPTQVAAARSVLDV